MATPPKQMLYRIKPVGAARPTGTKSNPSAGNAIEDPALGRQPGATAFRVCESLPGRRNVTVDQEKGNSHRPPGHLARRLPQTMKNSQGLCTTPHNHDSVAP